MPDFDRIDPMPVRALTAGQQKIDRGRRRAPDPLPTLPRKRGRVGRGLVAEHLAEMPAFRMRFQIEQPDYVAGAEAVTQNRFLRSRISANTFHAGLPDRPSDFATSASSARRNGLAAFSAPIVAGMVGLPAASCCLTSSARAASALLFGSMVLAKRILASVYSWPQKNCVSSGSARSLSSEFHIISGLPSMTRPQPIENSVSPTKASLSAGRKYEICPAVWPGVSITRACKPPTFTVSPSPTVS